MAPRVAGCQHHLRNIATDGRGRIAVNATFDGIAYRGSIVTMGDERILGVLKSIRSELRKQPGDLVTVTVEIDVAARSVDVPADLAAALEAANVRATFDALSYSHQREYVTWIDEAKKPETRTRRVNQTVDRVRTARSSAR